MVILPNILIDTILQNIHLREKYESVFPCWTGTYVEYNGEDCTVTQDGKSEKIKLHLQDGWYKVNRFGIPSEDLLNQSDPNARFLSRLEKNSGFLVRLDDFDFREVVFANSGASDRFGVACVSKKTYAKLLEKVA
jgi:hypothetical protein